MTETRTITEKDGITVRKRIPDLYGVEPSDGDLFYVWVPEEHPNWEEVRDEFYGWATFRGIAPEDVWSGIVPAAKLPFRLFNAINDSYGNRIVWVEEEIWEERCRNKAIIREERKEKRKKE